MQPPPDRRRFLQSALAGALGAGTLACARRAASRDLAEHQARRRRHGLAQLREEYDLDPGLHYLNHASIGTMPRLVRESRAQYEAAGERDPWAHVWGGAWSDALEETRSGLAAYLGCLPGELAFTRNTTDGFHLLARGLELGPGDEVLFSSLNHEGASRCWRAAAAEKGFRVRRFAFPLEGVSGLTVEEVVRRHEEAVSTHTRVLVLPEVDNRAGIRHPVAEIAAAVRRRGVRYVAVDGAQSAGMLPVDCASLGADFFATSGHKWLQGPKGTGLIYLRQGAQAALRPLFTTWGQRSWAGTVRVFEDYGTPDLPARLALGAAAAFQAALDPDERAGHARRLRQRARERAEAAPRLSWESPASEDLASSLYLVGLKGGDAREIFQTLNESAGYAFRPFHGEGLNALRLSPNAFNTLEEVDGLFDRLEPLLG